jgi:uncharacterized membrane protein YeiH
MPSLFEHFAVAVSAISGVLAASNKRIDLFGVMVLALVTALGGGTVRDVVLGATPVFWIKAPHYVINAVVTALVMFCIAHRWSMPQTLLDVADAFGLALFTMLGAAKALSFEAGSVNAVVLGVITGVAGGILRDVLVGQIPLVFRREIFLYATAAFCGATGYVLMERSCPGLSLNRLVGIGATLLLRLVAIQWRLSLPVFKS